MRSKLLIAAALVCAVMAPALAYSQAPTSGTFTATDPYAWSANGTSATTMTVTAPAAVTFEYPAGAGFNGHNVVWEGSPLPCDGNIPSNGTYGVRPWKGTCTFANPGTYRFECKVHDGLMKGTVVVVAPEPSATVAPTGSATPSPSPDPGATAQPGTTNDPTQSQQTQVPLSAKVASAQKGTSVRGSVVIAQAASRVEITVALGKRRVGRYVKNAAASGTRSFTVTLDAKTRKTLKRKHSLKLSVTVAVTPQGAATQSRAFSVRLRG